MCAYSVCVCGCTAVVVVLGGEGGGGVVSGSIWVSWKLCGVRKTASHKRGGSPMFYKDRTLLRMSLRKSLGSGPYVGYKGLYLSLFPLVLSLLIFHSVRDKKRGRQNRRRGLWETERWREKPALIAIPSVCIEQSGEQ